MKAARESLQDTLRRGFAALTRGRLEEASQCCREALAAQPDLVQGHFLIGLVATEMNDRRTAISAFGSVTRLAEDHAAAWAQLAKLFISLGHAKRADRALAKAVKHESGDPLIQDLIGTVYTLLGEQPTAHGWYQRAVKARPAHVPFIVNHANSLIYLGRTEAAQAELARALAIDPANPQANWLLSGSRRAKSREHVEQLEGLIPARNQSGSVYRATQLGAGWDNLVDLFGVTLGGDGRDIESELLLGSADDAEILTLGLQIDYDLGFATLTSTTGYKDHDYFYAEDFDASILPGNNYSQDQTGDYFQTELRLVSNNEGPLSWYAGASYYKEDIDTLFTQVGGEEFMCDYYLSYYGFDSCSDYLAYYGYVFTPAVGGNLVERNQVR